VFAQLVSWDFAAGPRAACTAFAPELFEQGGPALWQEFMDGLCHSHAGGRLG
jgi:hypothetical protein